MQDFEVTAATHPAGYTNKVLLGSRQGPLQLWNIMHDKLIYTFAGWGEQVTVLEQVCLGGALSLWWTAQVTVLEQVYGDRWCIVTVVGCAGHRTGTGVWGSLVHCRFGGMSRSLYWHRCVRVGGAFSLMWGEQVTILE